MARAAPEAAGTPRGRVLLVEDDPINQTVIRSMIEYAGWHCDVAADGHQALARLREQPFDLALMDWQMPELDGLEATRRLRAGAAGPRAQDLPVIGLTANAFAEDRSACLAAGMNDFLTKPVLATQLVAVVQRWIRRGGPATPREATAVEQEAAPRVPNRPEPDYDPSVLQSLPMVADGSDPGFAAELLQQFDQRCSHLIDAVRHSLDTGEGSTLLRSLHTLKSGAAQVGARALAAEAARQEARLRQGTRPTPDDLLRLHQRSAAFRQQAGLAGASSPMARVEPRRAS